MKPTPVQARLLRDLSAPDLWLEGFDGARKWRVNEAAGRTRYLITSATAKVLLDNEWIRRVYEDRLGYGQYRLTDAGRATLAALKDGGFQDRKRARASMTEAFIVEALARRHCGPAAFFHANFEVGRDRVDGVAMELYESGGYIVTAYEIKVQRGDFLREIKNGRKNRFIREYADEFIFAVPHGLIGADEVPALDGLLYVSDEGKCRIQKRPMRMLGPDGKKIPLSRPLVGAMLKKRGRMERQALRLALWLAKSLEGRAGTDIRESERTLLHEQKHMHHYAVRLGIINKDGDV